MKLFSINKLFNHIKTCVLPLALVLTLTGCTLESQTADDDVSAIPLPPRQQTKVELTLLAAGDNLIHGPIYRQANERTGGSGFDFTPAYERIAPYVANADIAFINQETPLGGTELGLRSYPMFNSPQELGTHLIGMGFNLISHANNHVLDAGSRGFNNTISFWRSQNDAIMAGIAANKADDIIRTIEIKSEIKSEIASKADSVSVALLAYTYGTNYLTLPASSDGIIKYIDDDLIISELQQANETADIVIVSMHWGVEYQATPNAEQQRLAQLAADNGADIIIGTHPHVIQTAEILTTADGREVPVFYSLGNLISAQNKPATMLGTLAEVDFTYDLATDTITWDDIDIIPVVNHYTGNYDNITVYPLAEYTEDMAASHGVSGLTRDYLVNLYTERTPEEYRPDEFLN